MGLLMEETVPFAETADNPSPSFTLQVDTLMQQSDLKAK